MNYIFIDLYFDVKRFETAYKALYINKNIFNIIFNIGYYCKYRQSKGWVGPSHTYLVSAQASSELT